MYVNTTWFRFQCKTMAMAGVCVYVEVFGWMNNVHAVRYVFPFSCDVHALATDIKRVLNVSKESKSTLNMLSSVLGAFLCHADF